MFLSNIIKYKPALEQFCIKYGITKGSFPYCTLVEYYHGNGEFLGCMGRFIEFVYSYGIHVETKGNTITILSKNRILKEHEHVNNNPVELLKIGLIYGIAIINKIIENK